LPSVAVSIEIQRGGKLRIGLRAEVSWKKRYQYKRQ